LLTEIVDSLLHRKQAV